MAFSQCVGFSPPSKEDQRDHEELIPPCETGRIINYADLEEGDSTYNYISPQYDGGEHVPHVPYVPFEEVDRLTLGLSPKIEKVLAKLGQGRCLAGKVGTVFPLRMRVNGLRDFSVLEKFQLNVDRIP